MVPAQQSPMTYQIAPYPKPAGDGPYPKPSTYVTFKFKYRTLGAKSNGAISSLLMIGT